MSVSDMSKLQSELGTPGQQSPLWHRRPPVTELECPTFPERCKQGFAAPESSADAFVGMLCSSSLPASAAPAAAGISLHKADIPGARKKPKHCARLCDGEQMRGIVIQMRAWGHFNPC